MSVKIKKSSLAIAGAGIALILCSVLAGACTEGLGGGLVALNKTPDGGVDTGAIVSGGGGGSPSASPSPSPSPKIVPHFSTVPSGYTGAALISYYDPSALLPVVVTGTLVVNINAAGNLEYDPSLTMPLGAIKSLTLTDPSFGAGGKEILIGRLPLSAFNEIKLHLDSLGHLNFRQTSDGGLIGSYAEFQMISKDAVTLVGGYKLEADLDLMKEPWEPVGKAGAKFTGTFDGDRKTLANLFIDKSGAADVGLFGVMRGTVKNLGIRNGTVKGGGNVGGIAGTNEGAIFACYNTGVVNGTGNNVGGVAGSVSAGGSIIACYNEAAVTGDGDDVGGLAGIIDGTMTACYNTGALKVNGAYVGGVAGYNNSTNITACYNAGAMTGTNKRGVVGRGNDAVDCYWLIGMAGGSSGSVFVLANGFNPGIPDHKWDTGDGSGPETYWKPGTVNGRDGLSLTSAPFPLPKLWFEL
ncbi:hypothetical protein AGMMS49942_07060 [Spirochaetia bacterium]|nr:hypothetical protein AGMMS49942_07060 [Spirochaetia bacterium]